MATWSVPRLAGRDELVDILDGHLDAVAQSEGRFVLLSGEAGIGKTTVCEEVMRRARSRAMRVAWTACWQSAAAPPLHPVRDLVDQLGGDADALLAGAQSAEAPADRLRLRTDRLCSWIRSQARSRPVVMVVDDLHWADPASAELISAWSAAIRTAGVLVLGTARPGEAAGATAPALAQACRQGHEVPVGPLDEGDMQLIFGEAAAGADIGLLHRVSGGNPLYVRELLALVARDRSVLERDELPAPPSVQALVSERIQHLDARTVDLVGDVAVLGDEVSFAILGEVRAGDVEGMLSDLDEAARAGVLRITDHGGAETVSFVHPLHRAALYGRMGTADQVRRHSHVARCLENLRAAGASIDAALLAHHFGRSVPAGNAPKAVQYAVEAGREARRIMAEATAARRFEQALAVIDLAPSAGDRWEVLVELGEARRAAGDEAGAATALDAAIYHADDDPHRFARAVLARTGGEGFEVPVADSRLLALLDRAIADLPHFQEGLLARLLARRSVAGSYQRTLHQRADDARRAIELARLAADDAALASALAARCDVIAGPAELEERLVLAEEIVTIATRIGARRLELLGRRFVVVALMEQGSLARAGLEVAAYEQVARSLDPAVRWCGPLWRAALAMARGDEVERRAAIGELDALVAEGAGANAWLLHRVHEAVRRVEHRDPAAIGALDEIRARYQGIPETQTAITHALVLQLAGRDSEALDVLEPRRAHLDEIPVDSEWVAWACQIADIAIHARDHDLARWAYDALLPHRSLWNVEGIGAALRGPVARWLASVALILGEDRSAESHRVDALAACERAGATFLGSLISGPRPAPADGATEASTRPGAEPAASLHRTGDTWQLGFGGKTVSLRDRKGIRDLAVLLSRPGREVAAFDLASPAPASRAAPDASLETLDETARHAYQQRLRDIDEELGEADRHADLGRSQRLSAERDAILGELSSAYGLGGRTRRSGGGAERARTAVTARIRDALRHVEAAHPTAGRHLARAVRTGTFCSYDPDPPVAWDLD